MSSPLISVLMGVRYQYPDLTLLKRSIESILVQTVTDFELLICDDGSTKQVKMLLDRYAANDERIILIRPGTMYSLPQKLNTCLKVASGKFIARMDDDDYSCPERFEEQLHAMNQIPDISFIGCNVALCRETRMFAIRKLPEFPAVKDFYMTQPYIHPTLLFRKAVLDAVGGYCEDGDCDHCEDYDLLLRLYEKGYRGMNLQKTLFYYTAPDIQGNRTMRHRWNEVITRWRRFRQLKVLPQALPFVIKPIVVGLLPLPILRYFKEKSYQLKICDGDLQ